MRLRVRVCHKSVKFREHKLECMEIKKGEFKLRYDESLKRNACLEGGIFDFINRSSQDYHFP